MRFHLPLALVAFCLSIASPARTFAAPSLRPPLLLINAATGAQITFVDGINIDPAQGSLWFVKAPANSRTSSVKFCLDSDPFTFDNDIPFTSQPGLPKLGAHALVITPYSRNNADGNAGPATTINFTVTSVEPTPTQTPDPTATPTPTPDPTPEPTATPSPPTPSPTPTPLPTPEPTPTPTPTPSPTPTATPTPSPSPSPTVTPTATPSPSVGATRTAASCALADVQAAINQSAAGDTVLVPAGSATYSAPLAVSKGITIKGAAVITTDTHSRPCTEGSVSADAGSTVITSNINVIKAQIPAGQTFRLSGFIFRANGTASVGQTVSVNGNPTGPLGTFVAAADATNVPQFRVDNCYFASLHNTCNILVGGWAYGVIDHNRFDIQEYGGACVRVFHSGWGNSWHGWGSWADDPYWGSEKFVFVEDNYINNLGTTSERGNIDSRDGGRYVSRWNWFRGCTLWPHGTEEGEGVGIRGVKQVELYRCRFDNNVNIAKVSTGQLRGGTILAHDNDYGSGQSGLIGLAIYRRNQFDLGGSGSKNLPSTFSWQGGSGFGPWDMNDTEGNRTFVDGHAPHIYETGTHDGAASGTQTIVDSSQSWSPNQWTGYSVQNTNPASPFLNGFNLIVSNTATTLVTQGLPALGPQPKWNPGDSYRITKVLRVLDQGGSGKTDLIIGDQSGPATGRGYPKWLHQIREPAFQWNNTLNGTPVKFNNNDNGFAIIHEGVDYFNRAPQAGDTCFPYTPFTYPHPLTTL